MTPSPRLGPSAATPLDEIALRNELRALRTQIPDAPWLNPITSLAHDLSRRLEAGGIGMADLEAVTARLMDRACTNRAVQLRQRIGYVDAETTQNAFRSFVESTITSPDGAQVTLEAFAERWARPRAGIVFTAHPTFGTSDALSARMVEIAATGRRPEPGSIGLAHTPEPVIDLDYEHRRAQAAVSSLRDATDRLLNVFFQTAARTYGPDAYKVRPRLATIASWVGYDLDGRTDITWLHSFKLRLAEKLAALGDIHTRFGAIRHHLGEGGDILRISRQITAKLDLAIAAAEEQARALANVDAKGKGLTAAANVITSGDGYNLTSVGTLLDLIDNLIDAVPEQQTKRSLASLRSLLDTTGLGMSHIHVRVNAAQLTNALRAFINEPWTSDLSERQALLRLSEMIANVKAESVNFGTLELETATAIRQFAMIAQIRKYVDADTPVRFLIAECESPATVLIAVFFAKLFGVSDIVDISPLFETPSGLERGARLMERLFEETSYREYVKGRNRLSIQTGFSDAGRFIGQIAATLAIERLHLAIADLIAEHGLGDVETLIFSTHGESMGRGAHPGDLAKRLGYLLPHEVRRRFKAHGLALKHESSFQGGDGFMFFADPSLSAHALTAIIADATYVDATPDPFYEDENTFLDFFLRLRTYQQQLFAHSGYRALLGAMGANLLYKTGSRAVKRQSDSATLVDRGDPSRMRAIPNNAILQQFGYVANIIAGLGFAAGFDRDRFVALAKRSPRMISLFEMIARGKQLSSLNAMGANAYVFDAGFWASRASWGREPSLEPAFRTLSTALLSDERTSEINRLAHHMRLDAIDLHAILSDVGLEGGKIPDDTRLEVDLLQAIRLALIMRIFILSAQLPKFAPRNDMSHERLLSLALSLDVPVVLDFMRQAFPYRAAQATERDGFNERATYRPHGIDDYARLETEILAPMEQAYELVRQIGTGISHHFGAFG
ncbi:MAG: phosphoenolpyruvate carboxylase [Hyphomicrobiaceae bacterium]|nr:phosphoenolpyruvate carboxylase [Hyphomicrobiaceae bacterium]